MELKLNESFSFQIGTKYQLKLMDSQTQLNITILIIVIALCIYIAKKQWGIQIMDTYYHLFNKEIIQHDSDMNKFTFHSKSDPRDLLLFNSNLTNITLNTEHLNMSYENCLLQCFKQTDLMMLTITTKLSTILPIHNPFVLPSLSYLYVKIDNNRDFNTDHLFPIIQRSRNIETIIYKNGYLDSDSMNCITKMKKLSMLILDNIQIREYKAFSIMLFNLKIETLIIKLKYTYPRN